MNKHDILFFFISNTHKLTKLLPTTAKFSSKIILRTVSHNYIFQRIYIYVNFFFGKKTKLFSKITKLL